MHPYYFEAELAQRREQLNSPRERLAHEMAVRAAEAEHHTVNGDSTTGLGRIRRWTSRRGLFGRRRPRLRVVC